MSISSDFDKQQLNVNTDFAGVVGDHAHIEGDIAFYQDSDKEAFFIEENLDDVRSDGFISPTHSQDIVQRVLSERFLLLSGKDRMGKAALSRHIADMLLQENFDELPVKKIRQSFDLNEVLEYLISEKTQDYIVLGYDININEIQGNIDLLRRIARQKSKYIIFTSELSSSLPYDLQEFTIEVQINYPYTSQNIEQLLKQYFQVEDIELGVELKDNIKNISKRLFSPSVAIRLAESLPRESALPVYNEWVDRLNDLNEFHKEVKNWLSNLGKDECILFLTLALFHDLPGHNFWMVYEAVIDEFKKRDPTLIKLDYYALEENREFIASVASGHRIAFKHIKDRESILLRLLKLYRRSLLTILPFLGKQIHEFLYKKDMRLATAEAVGYIGTVEEKDANDILYDWAKHKNPSVRAAVGHAHRQMIKIDRDALGQILSEMSRYLKENNVERSDDTIETVGPRWTVASSLGRINNYISEDRFEQDIVPILKEVSNDQHIAVRKAAVYSMRKIGLTRFQQIRPILARKAKDYRVEVQLEVAETLSSLSLSKKSDIHQLLQKWLVGQDEDRLWTAFYTFYLLDSQEEGQLNMLQQQILENFNLQSRIINKLNEMLTSKNISNEKIIDLFDSIARRNDISMNTILLVQILAENIYKHQKSAVDIVDKWRSSAIASLNELADIVVQRYEKYKNNMQIERDYLLNNELNNDELLYDFLKRLPEDAQDDFRNEVNAKRKYAMQVERDHLLKDELNNEKLLNNFALKLPENERSAFWNEVETKREERRRKKQKWIKISVGIVVAILLIKWIKVLAGAVIVLFGMFFLYVILSDDQDDHQERN